ncbi:MAG: DoxX family membrane protein [Verrucomicrobiota bacterium]
MGPLPVVHLSMFLLRCFSGLILIYYQGWAQVRLGWNHVWKSDPWPLVLHFAEFPTPVAIFFSVMIAVFFFLSPLLFALGFLTRLNALSIFIGILVALGSDLEDKLSSTELTSQTILLFLLITIFFILNGGGMLAADRLFDTRRGRSRMAGSLYS